MTTLAAAPPIAVAESPVNEQELPLSHAERGQTYRVSRVTGSDCDVHRLKALGFYEGSEVRAERRGGGWVVRLLGSRVGLCDRLAASVLLVAATTC